MGFAHEYATAVAWRGRIMMPPVDFVPNWGDKPRRTKFYPGADSFPLPGAADEPEATIGRGLGLQEPPADASFTLDLLGGMLRDSYGLIGRRLGVQANTDLAALPSYPQANWSRGSASGGGLYPVSIYWVAGPGGPFTPGVYYYATARHTMQRLVAGDLSAQVRAAVGDPVLTAGTDQYLVLGVKFWQNSFKYNSFSYHAVTMDVGALVQTWRMWGRARGLSIAPVLWFDEVRLSGSLGLDPEQEGLFAVVPLRWTGTAGDTLGAAPGTGSAPPARVRRADSERSRRVLDFDTLRRVHAATTEHAADRPPRTALTPARAHAAREDRVPAALPPPQAPDTSVHTALHSRRSSFGRFSAERTMTAEQLSTLLAAAASGAGFDCDVSGPGGTGIAKLYVFVNHVPGIAPGSYEYDPRTRGLRQVKPGPAGAFLQRNYFLSNYNLEQAGAVIVPAVRTHAVLDAVGARGIRLVNAVIGAAAQAVYTATAAQGLSCGVALGFDTISYIEELDLGETGEIPLLIMLVGHERPNPADFRHDLAEPERVGTEGGAAT